MLSVYLTHVVTQHLCVSTKHLHRRAQFMVVYARRMRDRYRVSS